MQIAGLIPARLSSTRLPKKLLLDLKGKTVLQRTWENARRFPNWNQLIILTEDQELYNEAISFGADAILTPPARSGTERIAEAISKESSLQDIDIFVNIQGDEPFLPLEAIEKTIEALALDPNADMSTAAHPLDREEAGLTSSVKVVRAADGRALYFSRSLIPGNKEGIYQPCGPYLRHIGLYAYRKSALIKWLNLPETPLQQFEDLEQLKALENGLKIQVALLNGPLPPGIDTAADLKKANFEILTT